MWLQWGGGRGERGERGGGERGEGGGEGGGGRDGGKGRDSLLVKEGLALIMTDKHTHLHFILEYEYLPTH